jgi:hypothetical protein
LRFRLRGISRAGAESSAQHLADGTRQADRIKAGETLRQQLNFVDYLKKRSANPGHSFRQHLRDIGGAIEE